MNDNKTLMVKNIFHEINDYIRNNIVLTKAQKLLFISSIFICLKNDINYLQKYNLYNKNIRYVVQRMMVTIEDKYNDEMFLNQFNFLYENLNSVHIKYLMDLIKEKSLIEQLKQADVLNQFFHEFVYWDSNSESKLGIVLTPDDVVQRMVKSLDIQPTDKVLDFCTGTGSFLIEASKYTKNVYGCERDGINYSITKCNFILHELDLSNLVYASCFDYPYEPNFDKIILNPPFSFNCTDHQNLENLLTTLPKENQIPWQNFTNEQKYILYGIQLLKEGGKGSFVIPRSNFGNNSSKNDNFKNEILKHCKIDSMITLSTNVFYPNAIVQCTILNITKQKTNSVYETEIVDLSNDGYRMLKNIRWYVGQPQPQYQKRILTVKNDWNYINEFKFTIPTLRDLKIYNSQYMLYTQQKRNKAHLEPIRQNSRIQYIPEILTSNSTQTETFKLKEYFKLITPKKRFTITKTENGPYPLISRSSKNNGIVKYINDYSLEGTFITVAPSGSTGATYLQEGKFAVDGQLKILQPIKDLPKETLHIIAYTLNKLFTSVYSYNNGLINQKILDTEIQIPKLE